MTKQKKNPLAAGQSPSQAAVNSLTPNASSKLANVYNSGHNNNNVISKQDGQMATNSAKVLNKDLVQSDVIQAPATPI